MTSAVPPTISGTVNVKTLETQILKTENLIIGQSIILRNSSENELTLQVSELMTSDFIFIFPPNDGDSGNFLSTDGGGTLAWVSSSSFPAAGTNTQIQYNDSGVFGASSDFTWDRISLKLTDGKDFTVGTGDDLVITHDGANGSMTNTTGNLTISDVNGEINLTSSVLNISGEINKTSSITPTEVGSIVDGTNLNGPKGIFVSGDYAYIASLTGDSLTIVDVSDPTTPVILSTLVDSTNLNGASGVFISGKYAYITAVLNTSLSIVDISNPNSPVFKGSLTGLIDSGESITQICVNGGFAYIPSGTTSDKLSIVDISNPVAPILVGSVTDGTTLNEIGRAHV